MTIAASYADTINITSSADAGLFENNPDNNLGGMDFVTAGTIASGLKSRALFKFDVAEVLPANATVTSASVTFNVPFARGAGRTFQLHRVLADWGEGSGAGMGAGLGAAAAADEVTWNSRFHGSETWTSPGAEAGTDYASTASATATMGASTLAFSSATMAADIQAWLTSPGLNFGWLILIADEAPTLTASRISTREDSVNAPNLTITYSVPTPAAPPTLTDITHDAGTFIFSFNAEADRSYAVGFRDSLTADDWGVITNIASQLTPTTHTITNPASGTEGYFRVSTQ